MKPRPWRGSQKIRGFSANRVQLWNSAPHVKCESGRRERYILKEDTLRKALQKARQGNLDGAIADLERAAPAERADDGQLGMLYLMLRSRGDQEKALDVACRALEIAGDQLPFSTWLLRRCLLYIELDRSQEATKDLTRVIGMGLNDAQVRQAQRALLEMAERAKAH